MTDLIEHLMDATDDELRAEVLRRLDAAHPRGTVIGRVVLPDEGHVTIEIDMDAHGMRAIREGARIKLVRVYEDES